MVDALHSALPQRLLSGIQSLPLNSPAVSFRRSKLANSFGLAPLCKPLGSQRYQGVTLRLHSKSGYRITVHECRLQRPGTYFGLRCETACNGSWTGRLVERSRFTRKIRRRRRMSPHDPGCVKSLAAISECALTRNLTLSEQFNPEAQATEPLCNTIETGFRHPLHFSYSLDP